jgi:hypothetical protein
MSLRPTIDKAAINAFNAEKPPAEYLDHVGDTFEAPPEAVRATQ